MAPLTPEQTTPVALKKKGGERITVTWADGHESVFGARYLRGRCPCAQCVSETSGKRLVFEEHVNPDVAGGPVRAPLRLERRPHDGHLLLRLPAPDLPVRILHGRGRPHAALAGGP